jgi:hypothetical protein
MRLLKKREGGGGWRVCMGRRRVEAVIILVDLSSTGHSRRVSTMTISEEGMPAEVDASRRMGTCLPLLTLEGRATNALSLFAAQ